MVGRSWLQPIQNELATLSPAAFPMIYFTPTTQIVLYVPQIFSCSVLFNHLFPEDSHMYTVHTCLHVRLLIHSYALSLLACVMRAGRGLPDLLLCSKCLECCSVGRRRSDYLLNE